ncbi:hypothetical protein ALC53_02026 [Atta colombica]|uniref:Uncharacterized protein n=1 Tax=Atta colombica TaxID=520822 RepID=A0A195BTG0_9HYME|nr:hypothetical protein ALC53_02026 [Atta colombica]
MASIVTPRVLSASVFPYHGGFTLREFSVHGSVIVSARGRRRALLHGEKQDSDGNYSSSRRETSRNLLTADDSSIFGIRLNTVETHGYSPPANLSRADWLLLFEGNRTEGRGTQLRVKLGAGKCSRVSEIRARRYSRGMEIKKERKRET